MHYRPSLLLSAAVVSLLLLSAAAISCCCFLPLLFFAAASSCCYPRCRCPSPLVPSLPLFSSLLVPSLLRAATRFSGTAFGLRPALAKSRRSGQPTHIRSEGARFLNRLDCRTALAKSRRNGQPTHIRSEGARSPEISLVPPGACEVPDAPLQASGACNCYV